MTPTEAMIAGFCNAYLDVAPQATPEMTSRVRRARMKISYAALLSAAPKP